MVGGRNLRPVVGRSQRRSDRCHPKESISIYLRAVRRDSPCLSRGGTTTLFASDDRHGTVATSMGPHLPSLHLRLAAVFGVVLLIGGAYVVESWYFVAPSGGRHHISAAETFAAKGSTDPSFEDQRNMTVDDWQPIPYPDYSTYHAATTYRVAVVLFDFSDETWVVADPKEFYHNLLFGNVPLAPGVPKLTLDQWLREASFGRASVVGDIFGPYTLPRTMYEYGHPNGSSSEAEAMTEVNARARPEMLLRNGISVLRGDIDPTDLYDFVITIHAQYDEAGTFKPWGIYTYCDPKDFPEGYIVYDQQLGPTSEKAAKQLWSQAIPGVEDTQAESSGLGVHAHEFAHVVGLDDNYFRGQDQRDYSGPWELMSRGAHNGPGIESAIIPPISRGSVPPHLTAGNAIEIGWTEPAWRTEVNYSELSSEPIVIRLTQRETPILPEFGAEGYHYLTVTDINDAHDWMSFEVVNRVGFDSFLPDRGVLVDINDVETGFNGDLPHIYTIDSHPDPYLGIEYWDPCTGEPVIYGFWDYRQLDDATFDLNAPGDEGEVDMMWDNSTHILMQVLSTRTDSYGVLSYEIAVSLADAPPASAPQH